jgi:hypothetical protein
MTKAYVKNSQIRYYARIEGILNQMDKRLNHLETEMVEFRKEVRTEIGKLSDKIVTDQWNSPTSANLN